MSIRSLSVSEWQLKRELRLAALQDSPKAFASSYEREVHRCEEEWRDWPRDGVCFAAFDDKQCPVGIVAGWVDSNAPDVTHLVSMWVAPAARGAGHAGQLVAAVIEWSRQRNMTRVELEVTAGNDTARRAYLRSGFIVTEREPSTSCGAVMELPI